jgi:hypothetical protein
MGRFLRIISSVETAAMTVNQEIKGNLAKLLATENLVVEHKKVPTACFDVERRVLTLPIWNKASASVYDMLVGHEVGHALYTPNTDWTEAVRNNVPKDFVNVVEDARIEKLMKRKFPGLGRSFYLGYNELNQDDFFCIKEENLAEMNLIDRINLHFKIGVFALVPFNEKEQVFVDRTANAETFDDVLRICEDLVDFIKQQQQMQMQMPDNNQNASGEGSGDNQSAPQQQGDNDTEETEETDQKGNQGQNNNKSSRPNSDGRNDSTGASNPSGPDEETKSKTQQAFDQNSEQLSKLSSYHTDTNYVEVPKINLENTVVDHKLLHEYIKKQWGDLEADRKKHWGDIFEDSDASYNKYKASAQKEVNYLVKEFECKKSADAYARAATSKTGVLDTKMLHTYRYNDDIFKKVTVIPDGKNHGLVFILDWSGSMNHVILDTVKQLLNLCWFCRKVQIPFEVYAFTYEWSPFYADPEWDGTRKKCNRVAGEFEVNRLFSLLNFMSSRANSAEFEQQAKHVWRLAYYMNGAYCTYNCPAGLDMSGTPLNESIITLHEIIPHFKNINKLQKVNVVILTDGEGSNLNYNVTRNYDGSGLGLNSVNATCALRDRKTGHVYRNFGVDYNDSLTAILLENLKHRFPEVNLIGFRIVGPSEFYRYYRFLKDIRYYGDGVPENVSKEWKKDKSYEIKNVGYDSLFAISSSGLSDDTSFKVSDDASTTEISKAFRGMLKKKTTNKKLLSSFASLVS